MTRPYVPECAKHPEAYNPDCLECANARLEMRRIAEVLLKLAAKD